MKKILIALLTMGFLGGCTSADQFDMAYNDSAMTNNEHNTFFVDSPVSDEMTMIHVFAP